VSDQVFKDIDPRAVVDPGAQIGEGVRIGPFAVIGKHVRIGKGTVVGPHAVVEGRTTIGSNNSIFQFASIGAVPQDLKYRGEESELVIGHRNRIREFVTIHLGTEGGGMVTHIGDDNLFMAYSHVAHDCRIGNRVIMANTATLAGHVTLEDGVIMGGMSGIHQFCRVGRQAFVAAGSIVVMDVAPFSTVQGDRARFTNLNIEGLKRSGVSPEAISDLKKAFRILFRSGLVLEESMKRAREEAGKYPEVKYLIDFIADSGRGITR
jgi:UDP-N-acetylglucosamine acyltransferase